MRIASNTISNNLLLQLQEQQRKQLDLQQQLATQQKFSLASQDPTQFERVKELQSMERAMRSYRSNLDRATLISDLSESNLGFLKSIARDAFDTSNQIQATIQDSALMDANANLINEFLEQALQTLNSQNGNDYLFGGSEIREVPFVEVRDATTGDIASSPTLTADAGETLPLVLGQSYIIESGTGIDFTTLGAANSTAGTTFIYNGTAVPAATATTSVSQVAATITDATKSELVEGRAYEIVSAGGDFTDSGSANNTVGTQFVYNGYLPTSFGTAELAPLEIEASNKITTAASLTSNKLYQITKSTPFGEELPNLHEGDTFAAGQILRIEKIGTNTDLTGTGASSSPAVGEIFIATGTQPTTFDGAEFKRMTLPTDAQTLAEESLFQNGDSFIVKKIGATTNFSGFGGNNPAAVGDLITATASAVVPTGAEFQKVSTSVTAGKTYQIQAIDAGSNDFSAFGGPSSAQIGEIFTATVDSALPANAAVNELTQPVSSGTLDATENYVIGNTSHQTTVNTGESYLVQTVGVSNDFSAVGGPNPAVIGDVFTATSDAALPSGASAVPVATSTVSGTTYQVRAVSAGNEDFSAFGGPNPAKVGDVFQANANAALAADTALVSIETIKGTDFIHGEIALELGATYTIIDNGSDADFSSINGPGANGNEVDVGDTFTTPAAPLDTTSVVFDGAVLVEVGGNGFAVTSPLDLQASTTYQVIESGVRNDFTNSGALNNSEGTTFIYNGNIPDFVEGEIAKHTAETDFVPAEAANNFSGTFFVSDGDAVEFGTSSTVYQLQPERTTVSDFTQSGAENNSVNTKFAYNGTVPDFGDDNGNGAEVVGFTRERVSIAYVGSRQNLEFTIAEGTKLSPFSDSKHNVKFAQLMNAMVDLRDAYRSASIADPNDQVALDAAVDKAKHAANLISDSEDDVLAAISDMGVTKLNMEIARSKDDNLQAQRGNMISRSIDIDQTEVVAQLNLALNSMEASLQSGARSMSLSILDFI